MKKKYTIEDLKTKKIAVHLPTEEEWDRAMELFDEYIHFKEIWNFKVWENNSCIGFQDGTLSFGSVVLYRYNYTIITLQDLDLGVKPTAENFVPAVTKEQIESENKFQEEISEIIGESMKEPTVEERSVISSEEFFKRGGKAVSGQQVFGKMQSKTKLLDTEKEPKEEPTVEEDFNEDNDYTHDATRYFFMQDWGKEVFNTGIKNPEEEYNFCNNGIGYTLFFKDYKTYIKRLTDGEVIEFNFNEDFNDSIKNPVEGSDFWAFKMLCNRKQIKNKRYQYNEGMELKNGRLKWLTGESVANTMFFEDGWELYKDKEEEPKTMILREAVKQNKKWRFLPASTGEICDPSATIVEIIKED